MADIKSIENIRYIAIHHSGGIFGNRYFSTQHHTARDVNEWHKQRWPDFKSELGWYGGYNFFIDQFGIVTQFRRVGEETAANKGHNLDTISICLAGNFTLKNGAMVNTPTPQQIEQLKILLNYFYTGMRIIKWENIVPHRSLQYTECYGDGLSDSWARDLIAEAKESDMEKLSRLQRLVAELSALVARLMLIVNKNKFIGHDRG